MTWQLASRRLLKLVKSRVRRVVTQKWKEMALGAGKAPCASALDVSHGESGGASRGPSAALTFPAEPCTWSSKLYELWPSLPPTFQSAANDIRASVRRNHRRRGSFSPIRLLGCSGEKKGMNGCVDSRFSILSQPSNFKLLWHFDICHLRRRPQCRNNVATTIHNHNP